MKKSTYKKNLSLVCLLISLSLNAQVDIKNLDNETVGQRWETDSASKKSKFQITPYQPVYVLIANYSNDPNTAPVSFNPAYSSDSGSVIPLKQTELKFQLSFKTKILQDIFWGHGNLWAAYTQTSRCQLYNTNLSRAFHETNYEPEFILNFSTNYNILGLKGKLLGISFNHQSNGRATPLSRSWNRIIGQAMFDREGWGLRLRAWYRLEDDDDENPQIAQYIGVGDILVTHTWKHHQFSALLRNNLNMHDNRGSILLDWAIPISGHLKGYIQFFNGYGESVIDYNHRQTTIGVGVSLINWR